MSKICLIGGSGFIGSKTCDRLIKAGHDVVVLDITPSTHINYHYCDIRKDDIQCIFNLHKFDYVFNFAAALFIDDCLKDPTGAVNTNVYAMARVIDACVQTGVKRFILPSTVHVYEACDAQFPTEDTPIDLSKSQNIYITTKIMGEQLVRTYQDKLPYTILRYGVAYGAGGHSRNVIHRFVNHITNNIPITIYGDGRDTRSFLNVYDHAEANLLALSDNATYRTINIDNSKEVYTINALVKKIEQVVGKKAIVNYSPARPNDYRGRYVINNLAVELIGWRPTISLEEGIKQIIV